MSRKTLELELLELRYKNYTDDLRECISRVVISERCEDTSDVVIDELCKKFPEEIDALLATSAVEQPHSVHDGSAPTHEAREFIRTFIDQARTYEAELGDLDDDDFEALYRSIIDPIVKLKRDRRTLLAQQQDRWSFFNKPEAEADFARWSERLLTPAQAVALSFGKDPDVVTPERLKPYHPVGGSPFRAAFKDRLDLIETAVAAGELSVPMSISTLVQWTTAQGLQIPPELTGEAISVDAGLWKKKYEAAQSTLDNLQRHVDEMWPKSKASIYMMILGMAIARFEHQAGPRTDSTKAIQDELENIGFTIGKDAIRDHLRDAARELDKRWPNPIRWSGTKRPMD